MLLRKSELRWLVSGLFLYLQACSTSSPRVRSIGNCLPDPDDGVFKCTSAQGVASDMPWGASRGMLSCFRNDELPAYLEGCK